MTTILAITIACFSLLIGLFAGYLINHHKTIKEYSQISLMMDMASRGEYVSLDNISAEGQLGIIYSQLNVMFRRMESYVELLAHEKQDMKEYIANISHQLKTPVTAISTYLQLLVLHETDSKNLTTLNSCLTLSEQMNQLITALLNMARIESDTIEYHIEQYNLNTTIDTVIDQISHNNINPLATIINDVSPDVIVRYDEMWMIEALFNIVKNSALYAGSAPTITIDCEDTTQLAILSIRDDGCGIDSDDLPHIFERFYRGHAVDNNEQKGLGIGLSMAKILIEHSHGRLEVTSSPSGTTFKVYFVKTI